MKIFSISSGSYDDYMETRLIKDDNTTKEDFIQDCKTALKQKLTELLNNQDEDDFELMPVQFEMEGMIAEELVNKFNYNYLIKDVEASIHIDSGLYHLDENFTGKDIKEGCFLNSDKELRDYVIDINNKLILKFREHVLKYNEKYNCPICNITPFKSSYVDDYTYKCNNCNTNIPSRDIDNQQYYGQYKDQMTLQQFLKENNK